MIKEDNLNLIKPAKFKMTDVTEKYLYGKITTITDDALAKFKYYPFKYQNFNVANYIEKYAKSASSCKFIVRKASDNSGYTASVIETKKVNVTKVNIVNYDTELQYMLSFAELSSNFSDNVEQNINSFNSNLNNWFIEHDKQFKVLGDYFWSPPGIEYDLNLRENYKSYYDIFNNTNSSNFSGISYSTALMTKLLHKNFNICEKLQLKKTKYYDVNLKELQSLDKMISIEESEYNNNLYRVNKKSRVIDMGNGNLHKVEAAVIKAPNITRYTIDYLKSVDELKNIYVEKELELIIYMNIYARYYQSTEDKYGVEIVVPVPVGVYKLYDNKDELFKLKSNELTYIAFAFFESKKYNVPVNSKINIPFYNVSGTFNAFSTNDSNEFLKSIDDMPIIPSIGGVKTLFKDIYFYPKSFWPDINNYTKFYSTPITKYINTYKINELTNTSYAESALASTNATLINHSNYIDSSNNLIFVKEYSIKFEKLPEYNDVAITYLYFTIEDILFYIKLDEPLESKYSFPIILKIKLYSEF
jgi:hypothetical protein